MRRERLDEQNRVAVARRPWTAEGYEFRPVDWHDDELHRLKSTHPYFGFVEVGVEGLGRFVMFSNNDDLVAQTYFWFGPDAYESYSVRVWRHLAERSSCIIDVGAYTGLFTLVARFAAGADAEVHAVEPIQRCVERLMINLRVNRLGQAVSVHDAAAGAHTGDGEIGLFQGRLRLSSAASLVDRRGSSPRDQQPVRVLALDDLETSGGPDLLKLDVEFAEVLALQGLRRTIEESAPTLLLEVTGRDRLEECVKLLPDHSFAVIDELTQSWHLGAREMLADEATRNLLWMRGPEDRLVDVLESIPPLPADWITRSRDPE